MYYLVMFYTTDTTKVVLMVIQEKNMKGLYLLFEKVSRARFCRPRTRCRGGLVAEDKTRTPKPCAAFSDADLQLA
jgi:hypothetical protein